MLADLKAIIYLGGGGINSQPPPPPRLSIELAKHHSLHFCPRTSPALATCARGSLLVDPSCLFQMSALSFEVVLGRKESEEEAPSRI